MATVSFYYGRSNICSAWIPLNTITLNQTIYTACSSTWVIETKRLEIDGYEVLFSKLLVPILETLTNFEGDSPELHANSVYQSTKEFDLTYKKIHKDDTGMIQIDGEINRYKKVPICRIHERFPVNKSEVIPCRTNSQMFLRQHIYKNADGGWTQKLDLLNSRLKDIIFIGKVYRNVDA